MNKKLIGNVLSALLTILLVSWFFNRTFFDSDDPDGLTDRRGGATPEWYWHTARYWSFNLEGQLYHEATATEVKHFDEDDTTYLSDPRFTHHNGEEPAWFTRADFGQMREDNNVVELYQAVKISRETEDVIITTERLVITQDKQLAETDLPITIVSETSQTDAVGMRAWFDEEKVELLDNVRTVHDPK